VGQLQTAREDVPGDRAAVGGEEPGELALADSGGGGDLGRVQAGIAQVLLYIGPGDGAVGGPIEIAGIAGRLADVEREAESAREGAAWVVAPTSMGRVTTTAGVDVEGDRAPVAGAGAGRGPGPSAGWAGVAFAAPDVDWGPDAPRDCGGCAAGIPRCVAFVATGVPFCAWGLGC